MPKISIIVPIYNVEQYIEECLNSIFLQTYKDYEIILVNDGSTDNSLDICYKYQKQNNSIKIYNKENGGLSSARNYGILHATGEYIIFIDPDDYWIESKALEKLINIANATNCDIVRGECKEVDISGKEIHPKKISEELYKQSGKKCSSIDFLRGPISRGNFVWLFLIRRATLGDLRFNEKQKFQEDIEFNIRYFSTPRSCVYIPLIFYAYRKRYNSLTSTLNIENIKHSFLLCDTFYKYSQKATDKDVSLHYMNNAIMMYYWTLETISFTPLYQKKHAIIKELRLLERQKQASKLAKLSKNHFPLLINMPPLIAIEFFRIKNSILSTYITLKKYLSQK